MIVKEKETETHLDPQKEEEAQKAEELKKAEEEKKVHTPPEDSERWTAMYAENQHFRRDLVALTAHNRKLTEAVNKINDKQVETDGKIESDTTGQEISNLMDELKEAADNDEKGKVAEIQVKINKLYMDQSLKKTTKPKTEKIVEESVSKPIATEEQAVIDKWLTGNSWFNTNTAMRGAAMELDREYASIPIEERLTKITEEIKEMFKGNGAKFNTVETGNEYGSPTKGKVLTDTQKRVAKMSGITEAQYLKQLEIIEEESR